MLNYFIHWEGDNDRMGFEFAYIEKWLVREGRYKNGIDVGCGTNRLSPDIVSIDEQADRRYAHAQLVHDCKDLEIFSDNALEFIFSSHVLEDFEDIPTVFMNWWRKLAPNGLMILLLPDIEGGRYAKVEDKKPDGTPLGNSSHRTNVGKKHIHDMLSKLAEEGKLEYEILQEDTIPHDKSSSIDFVIRKKK